MAQTGHTDVETVRRYIRSAQVVGACFAVVATTLTSCGQSLPLQHSETPCILPGQMATLKTTAPPGTMLSYHVQDDFGGELTPRIDPVTVDSSGHAAVTWQSPNKLSTTTIHFLLTARNGDRRANLDIHVVVGGEGRSC